MPHTQFKRQELPGALSSSVSLYLTRQLSVRPMAGCVAQRLQAYAPALQLVQNRLVAPTAQRELDRCLDLALDGQVSAMALWRARGFPITVRFVPETDVAFGAEAGLRVIVRDPEGQTLDMVCLQSMFGLTPMEAKVTAALARGLRSTDIADALGIQANTVLMHIKKVLSKTRTPHQVALLTLVLRSVALTDHA